MPHVGGLRAVVIGGGFAGSLAAAVLGRRGHTVTIVDRDPEPPAGSSDPDRRPGSPHADQLHNVLGRAQRHLRELVPDVVERFVAVGGQRARASADTEVFELGRTMPRRDLGLEIWSARKAVVDGIVAAAAHPQQRVTSWAVGLECTAGVVTGVLTDAGRLDTDLVVDAGGARSALRQWLEPAPEILQRTTHQWYTTMPVRSGSAPTGRFWMVFPTAPRTRGGLASPIAEGTWNVSVSGGRTDSPPADEHEFRQYVEGLEHPSLHGLTSDAVALAAPRTFRKPSARWRRYDRLDRLPAGLFVVGDAVADLDPLFGQGMSVAAWQVAELDAVLGLRADGDPRAAWTADHVQRCAAVVDSAWRLAALFAPDSEDALSEEEWDRLAAAVEQDEQVHRRYVEVWHLLRPVSDLRVLAGTTAASGR